jgi:hypothetical protein
MKIYGLFGTRDSSTLVLHHIQLEVNTHFHNLSLCLNVEVAWYIVTIFDQTTAISAYQDFHLKCWNMLGGFNKISALCSLVIWTKAEHWKLLDMNLIVETLETIEYEQSPVYPTSYTLEGYRSWIVTHTTTGYFFCDKIASFFIRKNTFFQDNWIWIICNVSEFLHSRRIQILAYNIWSVGVGSWPRNCRSWNKIDYYQV